MRAAHVLEFSRLDHFDVDTDFIEQFIIVREAHYRSDAAGDRTRIGEDFESGGGDVITARCGEVSHAYHERLFDIAEFHDFFKYFLRWGHGAAGGVHPENDAGHRVIFTQVP